MTGTQPGVVVGTVGYMSLIGTGLTLALKDLPSSSVGEPERGIDQLQSLMKILFSVSPAWPRIDPNFDPLRKNPRFQKLVAGAK